MKKLTIALGLWAALSVSASAQQVHINGDDGHVKGPLQVDGPITLAGPPTLPNHASTKAYGDAETTRATAAENAVSAAASAAQATANAALPASGFSASSIAAFGFLTNSTLPINGVVAGGNCSVVSQKVNCTGGGGASAPPSLAFAGTNSSGVFQAAPYTPANAALLGLANGIATTDGAGDVPAAQLDNIAAKVLTNLNTSTYNPGSLTPATFTAASTNADALGMNFMQFPGAHMDGLGNDCPAWNAAVDAVAQQWNQYHLITPIVLPLGHGRLYLNCTTVHHFSDSGVPGIVIAAGGHNAAVVQMGAAFNDSWLRWSNNTIGTWPNSPGTVPWDTATNAGPRVIGVTCAGVRPTQADPHSSGALPAASTVVQHCYDLRDNVKQAFFYDDDCYELPGSCIREGYTLKNTTGAMSALTDESDFNQIRCVECGLTAAASPDGQSHPPFDFSTNGQGDAFNQIYIGKMRATRNYSECAFWMHNPNNTNNGERQVHAIAVDIEDTYGGAGFCFGSPTDTQPVTFDCEQCVSLGARAGFPGVIIQSPPGTTKTNQIQGIQFGKFTSTSTSGGPNVDVESGFLHHFDFQAFSETQWNAWGPSATIPSGANLVSYGVDGYNYTNTSTGVLPCVTGSANPTGRGSGTDGTCTYTWLAPSCSICSGVSNPQWAISTSYPTNYLVNDGTYVWKQTAASCTSASSGSGPQTGATVTDGSCAWTNQGIIPISGSSVFTTNGNDAGMGFAYTAPGLPSTTQEAPVLQPLSASIANNGQFLPVFNGSLNIGPGPAGALSNPLALSAWAYLQKIDGRQGALDFQSSSDGGVTFHDAYTLEVSGTGEGTLALTDVVRGTTPLLFGVAGNVTLLPGSSLSASPSTADNSTKIATTAMVQAAVAAGGGASPVGNFYVQPGASQGGSTIHVERNTGTTTQSGSLNFETWDSGALTSTDFVLGTKAATGDLQLYATGFAATPFFDIPKSTGIATILKGTLLSASPLGSATDHELVDAAWVSTLYAPLSSPAFTGTMTGVNEGLSGNMSVGGNITDASFVNAPFLKTNSAGLFQAGTLATTNVQQVAGAVPDAGYVAATYMTDVSPTWSGTATGGALTLSGSASVGGSESIANNLTLTTITSAPFLKTTAGGVTQAGTFGTTSGTVPDAGVIASTFAPLASPALTGTPSTTTATAGDNSTRIASTAFVASALPAYPGSGVPVSTGSAYGTSMQHVVTTDCAASLTLSYDTPSSGTLDSVAYTTQVCKYSRVGSSVQIHGTINATMTNGTGAAGNLRIGLPVAAGSSGAGGLVTMANGSFAWPGTSPTMITLQVQGGQSYAYLVGGKTSGVATNEGVTTAGNCNTSCTVNINFNGTYDAGTGS